MKDLNLAISLEHPGSENGVDYEVRDDGEGPFVAFWNLPGGPPQNQQQVNAILQRHEAAIIDRETQRDPEFPSVEERLKQLEEMIEQQTGQTPPGLAKAREVRERVRGRPDLPGRGNT